MKIVYLVSILLASAVCGFSQQSGDLILGFRATGGTGSTTNLEVDLGNYSTFLFGTFAGDTETLVNLNSQLTADYGANWNTRSDVLWGIAGALSIGSTGPDGAVGRTLFATSDANSSLLDGNPTASILYNAGTAAQQGGPAARITTVYLNMGLGNPIVSIDATAGNSWSAEIGITPFAFGFFNKVVFDNTAAPQNAGGYSAGDLFELRPGSGTANYIQTFALHSNGDVTIQLPEPATYATFVGFGVFCFTLSQRRKRLES